MDRREVLRAGAAALALGGLGGGAARSARAASSATFPLAKEAQFGFGLVTYMWGADWDLPTLLERCKAARLGAVELRTTHKHGVEPSLDEAQREKVAARFADSGVTLVGLGSDCRFDSPDRATLKKNLDEAKAFLRLSHDIGGGGVKVKPNDLPKGVPVEKTIAQIAAALNELGRFAAELGQEVRLEVHGQCAPLPTMKKIMDAADHASVALCWNSNAEDLAGEGLAHNFALVRKRFGATLHVHELGGKYPYAELFRLLRETEYAGWVLLEASSKPADRAAALAAQKDLFDKLANG